jgi:DNA-directed RNA polymerase subunit RPC12/RpoP
MTSRVKRTPISEVEKEDIIATRVFMMGPERSTVVTIIMWSVIALLLAALYFWGSYSYSYIRKEYHIDLSMVVVGTFLLIFAIVPVIWLISATLKKRRNNKDKRPTITVRSDGIFVLYHPDGMSEPLEDKIHIVSPGSDTVTFILERTNGERYSKMVKNVANTSSAAARMKNILAYKDEVFKLTNYEKVRLFCQYCGSKVMPTDKVCSHCGGKIIQ